MFDSIPAEEMSPMMGKQISSFIKNIRKISSETSEQHGGRKLLMTTEKPTSVKICSSYGAVGDVPTAGSSLVY